MAVVTSTYPATGGFVDNTSAAAFIPEVWSDEVIAAYEQNLVLAGNVRRMSFTGKKGDTIHVPKPVRGAAYAKAENTAVTVQSNVDTTLDISIDQHWEYSKLIEDITDTQALESMRRFFTEDAGYALGKQVDTNLFELGKSFGDGDASDWVHSGAFYSNAGTSISLNADDTVAAGDDMTDLVIRGMIQKQDDADVPMSNRFWVVPPIAKNDMLGITRFSSSDFVGGRPVGNGNIGNIYGVEFYVSTNVPVIETAAQNAGGSIDVRGSILAHKDSMILVEQQGIRTQAQYKQEFLSNLTTSDRLYGVAAYRPDSAFVLALAGA
jgi:N4-gp56 family major capsid protein